MYDLFDETWPKWTGWVEIIVRDLDGQIVDYVRKRNLIVNAGLNLMRDALGGFVTDASIHYVAIGTSATAPAAGDTQLGAETFRKQLTSESQSGTGQLTTIMYLGPADAVGTVIAELGWFAGASANASANSGILVAHTLYSHTHTSAESIQITRTDTL